MTVKELKNIINDIPDSTLLMCASRGMWTRAIASYAFALDSPDGTEIAYSKEEYANLLRERSAACGYGRCLVIESVEED